MNEINKFETEIVEVFQPKIVDIDKLAQECAQLNVTDINDVDGYKKVYDGIQKLKKARVVLQKFAKSLRDEFTIKNRKIKEIENEYLDIIYPIENRLREQRDKIDQEKIKQERMLFLPSRKKLLDDIDVHISDDEILSMDETTYTKFYNEKLAIYQEHMIALEKEKQEQLRREKELEEAKQRAIEEERMRANKAIEDAKIKAKKDAEEAKRKAKIELEKIKQQKERDRILAQKKIEQMKLMEKQRIKEEKERVARLKKEQKEKIKRLKQEQLEKEKQRKIEEAEQKERKRLQQIEDEKKRKKNLLHKKWLKENNWKDDGTFHIKQVNEHKFIMWKKISTLIIK